MITSPAPLIALKAPQNVSLEEVTEALNKIWTSDLTSGDDGSLAGATRASTFSLIVYEPSETQQLLAELGYYTGPIDGIDGPRTKAAIQAAQNHLGLAMNGRSSPELRMTLREQLAMRRSQPNQAPVPEMSYALDAGGAGGADEVASQNPCRIIALCPVPESTGGVTAQVSAYCPVQKHSSGSLICCEYITLTGTDAELAEASGFIQSLLIGELPKFLWWKTIPDLQEDLFRKLSSFINLVIVDTSTFDEATKALVNIQNLHQQGINVADLNWRRLAAWQELTAEAFDPPSRREALKEVDRFVLDYEAGNAAQAFLYLGWLASRLKWKFVASVREGGDYDLRRIKFTNDEQLAIEAELAAIPVASPGEVIGDLIDLKLTSTNLEADCCTIICSETRGCMRMEAGGGAQSCRVQHVSPLTEHSPEVLMSQQLQRWGHDLLFEESLAVAAQILQAG
ncbi:glucose-6-phosphate dehydrogenase assembly protein OpcA [Altericista sp. CCNU0014]|uniref:glucose-6-phosphate dehydrogenase assembly protein OpcA n=1 Tax=Altericista sp. CCNU0014 TaxID=3082949 RepID=UPI003850DB0A